MVFKKSRMSSRPTGRDLPAACKSKIPPFGQNDKKRLILTFCESIKNRCTDESKTGSFPGTSIPSGCSVPGNCLWLSGFVLRKHRMD